jgi:hypothetical protein
MRHLEADVEDDAGSLTFDTRGVSAHACRVRREIPAMRAQVVQLELPGLALRTRGGLGIG